MSEVIRVLNKLVSKFQADAAGGVDVVYQILVEDHPPHFISIKNQECLVQEGEHPDPNITLLMDVDTFSDIVDGNLGGTQAYMSGRLRAEGNVMLATQLSKYFKR